MAGGGICSSSTVSDVELRKIITAEKIRSEQHRQNYLQLKTEHNWLQEEHTTLQNELKLTLDESRLAHDKTKVLLDQVRRELVIKQHECDELQIQLTTEPKREVVKLQLSNEIEKPFRTKIIELSEELEFSHAELNKLKYEYSFIKAEYEHNKNENMQIFEELKYRHEAEVSNLRKERETILSRLQGDTHSDAERARSLKRDNAQLHLKVKGLLNELEEIRAQREHQGFQSDHVTRLQSKQLAEHAVNVKSLETERESLKLQLDNISRELASNSDLHISLTSHAHELEKENLMFKNRIEEITHKSKVVLTSLKMSMIRERGELERERDKLSNQCEDMKSQLEIAQCSLDAQSEALIEKEKESTRRVQDALQKEWTKLTEIESEKMEMETKLQEIERRKIDEETRRQAEKEAVEERMQQMMEAKDEAEKASLVLRTKQQHYDSLMDQMEQERMENSDLKVRLHRVETELQMYLTQEHELMDHNQKLKAQMEQAYEELRQVKDSFANSQVDLVKRVSESKTCLDEEKLNMQKAKQEQDEQLRLLQQRFVMTCAAHKRKKRKYADVVAKLKRRLSFTTTKLEQLQDEMELLKKSDQQAKLKKQLDDLRRRHCEFSTLIASSNPCPVIDQPMTSSTKANLYTSSTGFIVVDNADLKAEKEVKLLMNRLDHLDDNQRQQMEELRTDPKVSRPPKLEEVDSEDST